MRYIAGHNLTNGQKKQIRKLDRFRGISDDEIDGHGWLISSNWSFPHNYKVPHPLRVPLADIKARNQALIKEYEKKRINAKLKAEGLGTNGKRKRDPLSPSAVKKLRVQPSYVAVEAKTRFVPEFTLIKKSDMPLKDK